ncbi:MAG TPA: hypothetical protein ENI23_17415 [bacterium]|nr:hypothetical protein [bacterium]
MKRKKASLVEIPTRPNCPLCNTILRYYDDTNDYGCGHAFHITLVCVNCNFCSTNNPKEVPRDELCIEPAGACKHTWLLFRRLSKEKLKTFRISKNTKFRPSSVYKEFEWGDTVENVY